jgi:hypothetical protein
MFDQIFNIIKSIERTDKHENFIPPTILYNEGWLLRIILNWFYNNRMGKYLLSMEENAYWFSEALLSSKFLAKFRGDKLAESYTHADGAYGNIKIGGNGKGDLVLENNCKQFCIVEAKLYSRFSKGITNAQNYNQAARTIVCMCNIIEKSKNKINDIKFITIIPKDHKKVEEFKSLINVDNIKKTVLDRINLYNKPDRIDDYENYSKWYMNTFLPFCDMINIPEPIFWDDIIKFIKTINLTEGKNINSFYDNCKKYSCGNRV